MTAKTLDFSLSWDTCCNRKVLHMCHFMGNNESARQAFIAIESAAPLRIARPGDGSVSRRTTYVWSGQPHGHVVMSLPRSQWYVQTPVPAVDILQRFLGITRSNDWVLSVLVKQHFRYYQLYVGAQGWILINRVDLPRKRMCSFS